MRQARLERYAPLTGIVFVALIAVLFALTGDSPESDDSKSKVITYWNDHHSKEMVAALLGGLAVVFFLWFASAAWAAFRTREGGNGRLSATFFAGAILFAVGGAIASSIEFAAADTAGDVPGGVTHTLSVLNSDVFITFVTGIIVTLLAAALLTLRFGVLPRWLAYLAILTVIVSLTPIGPFGFLGMLIWTLVASIVLYRQQPAAAAPTATPAGAGTA